MSKKIDWDIEISNILDLKEQGLTNNEIANIYKVTPETICRGVAPFSKGYNLGLKSNNNIEQESLNKKHLRVLINQKKVTMIKRELNQETNKAARFELLTSKIENLIKPMKPLTFTSVKKASNYIPYYLISDTHWVSNEENNPKNVLGNFIFNNIINDIKFLKVNEINLIHMGDFIEGRIHNSQDWDSGSATIINQALEIAEFLIQILTKITKKGIKINYYQVANGNHDELPLSGKGANRDGRENVSWIIARIIKKAFSNNPNINVKVEETLLIRDKYTRELLYFTHLYTRSANPKNVPQLINTINYQREIKKFKYSFSGHNHMLYSLDFKGQPYKAYGIPATKIVQNTFEKNNNLYSTQGFCRFLKQSKSEIDWKYWQI